MKKLLIATMIIGLAGGAHAMAAFDDTCSQMGGTLMEESSSYKRCVFPETLGQKDEFDCESKTSDFSQASGIGTESAEPELTSCSEDNCMIKIDDQPTVSSAWRPVSSDDMNDDKSNLTCQVDFTI